MGGALKARTPVDDRARENGEVDLLAGIRLDPVGRDGKDDEIGPGARLQPARKTSTPARGTRWQETPHS